MSLIKPIQLKDSVLIIKVPDSATDDSLTNYEKTIIELSEERDKLKKQNKLIREGLEWYSQGLHYVSGDTQMGEPEMMDIIDNGQKARDILKQIKE